LQTAIKYYTSEFGYRLEMIKPADDPCEAVLSKKGISIRLVKKSDSERGTLDVEPSRGSGWVTGRAGMMYRDLVPDRLGGKLIAWHIRIVDGDIGLAGF